MIAIIDSGGYNLASLENALLRLQASTVVTKDPEMIQKADHVILPGVGAARAAMEQLHERGLIDCIRSLNQPVLGICLGMQLLFDHSEEGDTELLGLISGEVTFLQAKPLVVPHMGWNQIEPEDAGHPMLKGIPEEAHFYFVHSYRVPKSTNTLASTTYGETFSAMVQRDNFFGTQFHPEKSSGWGQLMIRNFISL